MADVTLVIEMLDPDSALDGALMDDLTRTINEVYALSEAGLWIGSADRTTVTEVAALVASGQIAVARLGERAVGSVRLQRLDATTGEFGMLVAAPDVRGAGIGRALVAFAEQWATGEGFEALQLEVLSPRGWTHPSKEFLRTWYTRIGFEPVRLEPFEEAFPTLAAKLATPCDFTIYRKTL